ncbi:type IV secretory system conjugative DNA transfer family protein [Shimia sp. R11_0]|uniref:type IV secretory system conjugative DNA transfer family protein n=1 Tax=Shimia sp. R11_0 TaxID=2821096 RepID=UPI001ADA4F6F|nr:type IV secretory system conjugative DNA transfer family protein [Shimia sp. R11_0]MBO9479747.1 type IV secretory system conjugative DNA transfer family protein [Shimia sp. R11_0]
MKPPICALAMFSTFSPYEYQTSHHYNPLDFVSRDPMEVWNDSGVLASALIRPDGKGDAHWERRARDQLAAFICYVVLHEENKSMETVMDCLAASEEDLVDITLVMANSDIGGLRRAGKSMSSLVARSPKMFEGNIETMRGHLSIWEDDRLASITKHSDWNPKTLREEQTTVYLCVPLEAVEMYASVLRVIIAQHVAALTPADKSQSTAVKSLLLLDEAPQLGRMEPITKAIEVGRSYGLRTWLFAQYMGQLHNAYGRDIAEGMVNSCGVVSYMNVGEDGAAQLSKQLGDRHSLIHGEKTPLATASDLTGPRYRDNVIVVSQGEHPALLGKLPFYQILEMEK